MGVFLDASYVIALADPKDPWNRRAKDLRALVEKNRPLHTHALAVAEVVAAVGSRCGGKTAQAAYEALVDDTTLHYPVPRDFEQSMVVVRHYDGTLSLSDAYALKVIEQEGLKGIVSFDDGFDGKGVKRLGAGRQS